MQNLNVLHDITKQSMIDVSNLSPCTYNTNDAFFNINGIQNFDPK